jgi:hypothetical protein
MIHLIRTLLSLSCLLFVFHTQANTEVEQELIKEIDLRLKLNSLILEVATQIDQEYPHLKAWQNDDELITVFRRKGQVYADFYLENIHELSATQKNLFRRIWDSIQWPQLVKLYRQTNQGIQTFFKKRGIGVGVAIFLGLASEYITPLILSQIGATWLIPIFAFMPYQLIYSLFPKQIIKFRIRSRVARSLGGQFAYQAYLKQEKLSRQALKSVTTDSILIPLRNHVDGTTQAINLKRTRWFKSLLQRLGIRDEGFSYTRLKRFLDEYKIEDVYINQMLNNSSLKDWQKAALITSHLYEDLDSPHLQAFKKRFADSFLELKTMQTWNGFEDWAHKLLNAQDVETINHLLKEIPKETPNRLILDVLDKVLLPHYASQRVMSYSHYRRLIEDFNVLKAEVLVTSGVNWSMETHHKFLNYFARSFQNQNFLNCQNAPQKILRFLISH